MVKQRPPESLSVMDRYVLAKAKTCLATNSYIIIGRDRYNFYEMLKLRNSDNLLDALKEENYSRITYSTTSIQREDFITWLIYFQDDIKVQNRLREILRKPDLSADILKGWGQSRVI